MVTSWWNIANFLRFSAATHCACFFNAVLLAVTCSLLAGAAAFVSITKVGCLTARSVTADLSSSSARCTFAHNSISIQCF